MSVQSTIKPPCVLTPQDCQLLNMKELAERLNVSYDFGKDMRKMGFSMPFGGRTTLTNALEWLKTNPNFRDDARQLKLSKRRGRVSRRPRRAAGKYDESPLMRDGRSSSPNPPNNQHGLAA